MNTSVLSAFINPLQCHHNGRDGVSWLFTLPLIQAQSKEISAPLAFVGNSLLTGELPTQMTSNAENGSISWIYHWQDCTNTGGERHLCWSYRVTVVVVERANRWYRLHSKSDDTLSSISAINMIMSSLWSFVVLYPKVLALFQILIPEWFWFPVIWLRIFP